MDPQSRLFLEETWKAFEHAGYGFDQMSGTKCGVFVGCVQGDYVNQIREQGMKLNAHVLNGYSTNMLAARISYYLNLSGKNLCIDTACSSSLVAIHEACQSILHGECNMALAGGVYVASSMDMYIMTSKGAMLSKTGRCSVFDGSADGFVPSEAVGCIVLKRLIDAIKDHDSIYGVIKGSAINYDGRTNGITAPSMLSQAALEQEVYEKTGINPKSKKIPFTLMGNPFHLNDEICRMLKACGCDKYQMSLDGMRETHDWFRKPGSFDLTIEKIGCLNRAGIKCVIMSTVSKTNMDEIPDIIDEVVKAKVKVFAFSRYVPTGGEVDTSMTPEEYRKLLEVCDAKYKAYEKAGCETYFNKKDHLWTLYEYETGEFKLPESTEAGMIYGGCNCGNCHITISSNGDIMACRRVTDSKVTNIFEDRLADVWICQLEKYRDYDKFVKCSKCELKAWCRGCPAVANGTSGNFYGADPQCWKTRNEITGEVLSC